MPSGLIAAVLPLEPAYGRQYHGPREAYNAWWDGSDWKIHQGPYCSIRDSDKIHDLGFTHVDLTYLDDNGQRAKLLVRLSRQALIDFEIREMRKQVAIQELEISAEISKVTRIGRLFGEIQSDPSLSLGSGKKP